jgi:hypothetical protein
MQFLGHCGKFIYKPLKQGRIVVTPKGRIRQQKVSSGHFVMILGEKNSYNAKL